MPDSRTPSPEKELLKLIEESKIEPANIKKTTFIRQSRGIFSFGAWKGRFLFLKERLFKRRAISVYEYDLRWLNRILEFSILILAFYLVSSIFSSINNLKKVPSLTYRSRTDKPIIDFLEKSLLKKSVESYLEKVSQRDIFNIVVEKTKPSTSPKPTTESTLEALNNLKLVGISWSENPDAMIEDTKAMRTFFVKRGQMLGDFKIKAIYKDRVILSYGEQEFELK
ncbi:MAG: hypothetical protein NC900_03570 [Candidatus Omnitrophica bacterium]|nr:hypothetical protein [Candidatus Omnitrophota bacterium]MCM8799791.1 hypothetical protein [Candidatus Omnitrophota bacterium]